MKKIKAALFGAVLAMMALAAACAPARGAEEPVPNERTKIAVTVKRGTEAYAQVEALEDAVFMEELETRLGVDIEVRYIESDWAMDRIDSIPFEDILITDEPYWMLVLAQSKLLSRQPDMASADAAYGIHVGRQYAYVFEDTAPEKIPYILVLPDAFEREGIRKIAYSPEAVRDMLVRLKGDQTEFESETYRYPLAVCGDPLDAGFCILQQLYGLAPSGGRECFMGDGTAVFDKLTQNGYDYLTYLHTLYEDGLLSPEFQILQENASARMMSDHISAVGVYTDPLIVKETVRSLQNKGIRVAYATLPVDGKGMETDVYKRLLGMIHIRSAHEELARQVLIALDGYERAQMPEDPLAGMEEYPLFRKTKVRPHAKDPFEEQPYSVLNMYRLFELDQSILETYYRQSAIYGTDEQHFYAMVNSWETTPRQKGSSGSAGTNVEMIMKLAASNYAGRTE